MTLNELYRDCENNHIEVYPFKMKSSMKGIALPSGDIGLDLDKIEDSMEEKEILAHEESHILGGYFYTIDSPLAVKGKQERRAVVLTIKKLIPRDELIQAIRSGLTEHWELAEYFEVSCKFMLQAMEYYGSSILH